jgi:hypothetical protein
VCNSARSGKGSKHFFSEEKKQKTFILRPWPTNIGGHDQRIKVFLVPAGRAPPFFKKRTFLLF